MVDDSPSTELVRNYIQASQRARTSGDAADFEAMREFMADDFETKVASAWTDEPWQVMQRGADAVIMRLQAPINRATSLTTENVTVKAGRQRRVRRATLDDRRQRRHPHQHGLPHLHGGRRPNHRNPGLPQRTRDPYWLKAQPSGDAAVGTESPAYATMRVSTTCVTAPRGRQRRSYVSSSGCGPVFE